MPTFNAVNYVTGSYSSTYAWGGTNTDSGKVTVYVDESCMLSTFNDPTQIFTDFETKVETYVQGMPNFTTRVKKWDETLPEDAWADENFPWDTAHIEVNDTLEIKKGNASHCEERKFTLSVASSETDPLAARLL